MPQTREHFHICRLLHVPRGLIVLTKTDVSDREMLELARLEVRELVSGSFLADAPIVAVSSRTGDGLERLKETLVSLAASVPARRADGPVRLPIDRVFSMKGFGTVVTGTLTSGRVETEQALVVLPTAARRQGARPAGARPGTGIGRGRTPGGDQSWRCGGLGSRARAHARRPRRVRAHATARCPARPADRRPAASPGRARAVPLRHGGAPRSRRPRRTADARKRCFCPHPPRGARRRHQGRSIHPPRVFAARHHRRGRRSRSPAAARLDSQRDGSRSSPPAGHAERRSRRRARGVRERSRGGRASAERARQSRRPVVCGGRSGGRAPDARRRRNPCRESARVATRAGRIWARG